MTQDTQTPQQPQWRVENRAEEYWLCSGDGKYAFRLSHVQAVGLREILNAQQQRIVALSDEKSKLTDSWMEVHNLAVKRAWRIEALEAALRKYARHLGNCEVFASFMVSEGQVGFDCSCGYDALQQPKAGSS